jgi:hypothetical protein
MGVTRAVEDLAALAGERVVAVTAETPATEVDSARLYVGTEAVLHQVGQADVVAFLDLDQELLAPRYRAAEEALGLVARAARLVGGRRDGGRVLLQTRTPDHEVCRAALLGDPTRVSEAEDERRALLGFPPHRALAEVGDQPARRSSPPSRRTPASTSRAPSTAPGACAPPTTPRCATRSRRCPARRAASDCRWIRYGSDQARRACSSR